MQGILKGEVSLSVDVLLYWFGLVCSANKIKNCQLSYSRFQTSQTGGQRYSDTSPFSTPWLMLSSIFRCYQIHNCQRYDEFVWVGVGVWVWVWVWVYYDLYEHGVTAWLAWRGVGHWAMYK